MKTLVTRLMLFFFAFVFSADLAFAEANARIGVLEGVKPISLSEAQDLLGQPNVYFIDVTSKRDRQRNGYIKDSISVHQKILKELLPNDKNATLVFYGLNRFEFEASKVADAAISLGYQNSVVMLDGIEGWVTSGREVLKENIIKWESAKDILEFKDTIHSRLTFDRIPSCRDCHAQENKGINVTTAATMELVNQNCASCHKNEAKAYDVSVHGPNFIEKPELVATKSKESKEKNDKEMDHSKMGCGQAMTPKDTKEKPSCNTCHSVHITPTFSGIYSQKQIANQKCAQCHESKDKSYTHSFHGKGMVLSTPGETPTIAACYDCHGKHNIYNSQDRNSTLSIINRVQTCSECHPNSTQNFTDFLAHADHTDKENYPMLFYIYLAMTSLVIGVFGFFGLHTLLWAMRLIILRLKHPKAWKEARQAAHHDRTIIRRFSTLHRIQHLFMGLSFLGLAFSGLPQKFYDAPWAKPMIDLIGGDITNATFIHHTSAIVMFAVFFSHLAEIAVLNWRRRDLVRNPQTGKIEFKKVLKALFGPDSLMPNLQDLKDIKDHFKWFIGKGPRPQFDRWTYWEKFDYLAVFWGMFVIGLSGLILWFPVAFSSFLPGWALNVATIFHSDEALLAIGFIFAIHFFNTHFRADRFPMDTVIFSGTLTEEEIKQERSVWYERLSKSGKLEKLYEKNSKFSSYSWIAKTIGFLMLATGLFFLSLMIYYAFIHFL